MLTAFNVESYHLLQPDPTDPTLAILKQISAQLNGYTLTPPFLNATNTPGLAQVPFQAPASAVWLNSLWFSSLVFSFAAAMLALASNCHLFYLRLCHIALHRRHVLSMLGFQNASH